MLWSLRVSNIIWSSSCSSLQNTRSSRAICSERWDCCAIRCSVSRSSLNKHMVWTQRLQHVDLSLRDRHRWQNSHSFGGFWSQKVQLSRNTSFAFICIPLVFLCDSKSWRIWWLSPSKLFLVKDAPPVMMMLFAPVRILGLKQRAKSNVIESWHWLKSSRKEGHLFPRRFVQRL